MREFLPLQLEMGRRLLHWRETWVFFTIELYRDVPEESP